MAQLLTGRNSVAAKRIQTLLVAKIGDAAFTTPAPAIAGVSYGDQDKWPKTPWICVEPQTKTRTWPPTPTDATDIELNVSIYVYHADVTAGDEQTRYECDLISEAVEEYLNSTQRQLRNAGGDDLVIYSYCVENESGYVVRGNTMFRAARLTWRGRSKLRLTQTQ